MESLLVTLVLETSKKSESDLPLSMRVNARNDADALILAKKLLKSKYPNLNFRKIWCWFVEGKQNRK